MVSPAVSQLPLIPDPTRPQGLCYIPAFLTIVEEAELAERIGDLELSPFQFQQWQGKRRTASFGYHYDYGNARLMAAKAIPDWLLPYRSRIAGVAGCDDAAFVQAMITEYCPGAGIGWHRDRPDFDVIAGISLMADCTLRFRSRQETGYERANIYLEARSAYIIRGKARAAWYHSIAPQVGRRLSITFRSLNGTNVKSPGRE